MQTGVGRGADAEEGVPKNSKRDWLVPRRSLDPAWYHADEIWRGSNTRGSARTAEPSEHDPAGGGRRGRFDTVTQKSCRPEPFR